MRRDETGTIENGIAVKSERERRKKRGIWRENHVVSQERKSHLRGTEEIGNTDSPLWQSLPSIMNLLPNLLCMYGLK